MAKRRRGRTPPPNLDSLTPNLPYGYLDHRKREMEAYDQLPAWARKILRRTKNQYQATQLLTQVKKGKKPLDILRDIEECEKSLSRSYLDQFKLRGYVDRNKL
jgi:capsule polysaccharide modification protein KpsS